MCYYDNSCDLKLVETTCTGAVKSRCSPKPLCYQCCCEAINQKPFICGSITKLRNTSQSFMSARKHTNSTLQRHHTPDTAASDAADLGHFHVSVQGVEHRSKPDNLWPTLGCLQIHTLQQNFPESHGHTARFGSHHTCICVNCSSFFFFYFFAHFAPAAC